MGILHNIVSMGFVFVDAVKIKERSFLLSVCFIFISLNVYNGYRGIFTDEDHGMTLISYTFRGKKYSIDKRSTQRAISFSITLYSLSAFWALWTDKKMLNLAYLVMTMFFRATRDRSSAHR